MVTLVFLFTLAVIIGAVLAVESGPTEGPRRPVGLMTWLTSGNWPAKIGGGLLVVGIGALLRYAAINIEIAPAMKLGFGVLATAGLMVGSLVTGRGAAQRTLSLVLGGAAFGVAYLTAYSAFALFGYLRNPATGVGLLALVSVAAGIFATTRSAISLALLAMVGAYLAPAFAIGNPGPAVVYGYYAAVSALTLAMVMARGWRPLIHVSFLFTLAGGLFFAWTTRFYAPEHFDVMAPLLLLLTALHVAMPIAEHRHLRGPWLDRLDVVYLLSLPAVATVLAYAIAPSRTSLAWELVGLGVIWLVAAGWLRLRARDGMAAHAVIGIVLLGLGAAARFRGLPWELIALAFSVGALAFAVRRSPSRTLHSVLAGLVLLLGAVHILSSLAPIRDVPIFFNAPFIERLVGAALIIIGGIQCRRVRQALDTVLLAVGIGWAIIAIGAEVIRWDLVSFALFLHWALLATALALCFVKPRNAAAMSIPVAIAVAATAIYAADSAPQSAAWFNLFAAPLALIALAMRRNSSDNDGDGRVAAAIVVPVVAAVWAYGAASGFEIRSGHFPLCMATLAALLILLVGRAFAARSGNWLPTIEAIFAAAFAIILAAVALFDIERVVWAALLELGCLAGLLLLAIAGINRRDAREWIGPAAIIGVALVLQANLLRWLGPPGDLTVFDLAQMRWPTLVSLLWAAIGAAMTVLGRRKGSRSLWVGGAALLVASAIKLVLVDFGTLGELANILAVIAAGGVFLLVGWLAPMPPAAPAVEPRVAAKPGATATSGATAPGTGQAAAPREASATMAQSAADASATGRREETVMPEAYWKRPAGEAAQDQQASGKMGWTIALIAIAILLLVRCGNPFFDLSR